MMSRTDQIRNGDEVRHIGIIHNVGVPQAVHLVPEGTHVMLTIMTLPSFFEREVLFLIFLFMRMFEMVML